MKKCAWHEENGYWVTSCGHEFVIINGTPAENEMKYCCYCGKEIAQDPDKED